MSGPRAVTEGATLRCSLGTSPGALALPPDRALRLGGRRLALVSDHGVACVLPFGMCSSPANPQVSAATAAAGGALTPQPCVPAVDAPWSPGAAGARGATGAVLREDCAASCRWGGAISVDPQGATGRVGAGAR
ncbi:MAG: DUF4280 domain-containing protein [Polyangiales bacterium]